MIPGLPQDMLQGSDEEGAQRMKRMIFITDSMTSRELDSDGTPFLELGKDGKPVAQTAAAREAAQELETLNPTRYAQLPPEPRTSDLPF